MNREPLNFEPCPEIHLDCCGIALRFILPDAGPCRTLCFASGVDNAAASEITVRVLAPGEAAPGMDSCAWLPIDGAGEYEAAFNARAGCAWVRCSGETPGAALANFARRLFMERIPILGGAVLHASCVARDGDAYVFAGKSGAGKSTVCTLSKPALIVADDLCAVRVDGACARVWGLPEYDGNACSVRTSGPFPLVAMFRLVKAGHPALRRLSAAEAIAGLIALPVGPEGNALASASLAALASLAHVVPCHELRFSKDPSFWACINVNIPKQTAWVMERSSAAADRTPQARRWRPIALQNEEKA